MRIQVFSEYYNLAQAGKLKFPACPMHQEDILAEFGLIHKINDQDVISLECMACGYKLYPGIDLYDQILRDIEALKNESEKTGGSL